MRNFISAINPPVERGYLREIPPDGISSWQYSAGYRTPLFGGWKAYRDSRKNGATVRDALDDALAAQYLIVPPVLIGIGSAIASLYLIPID